MSSGKLWCEWYNNENDNSEISHDVDVYENESVHFGHFDENFLSNYVKVSEEHEIQVNNE